MQYYQQLFKAKGHRAMLFADSITKSLAVRVLLKSYNDESIPQKKHNYVCVMCLQRLKYAFMLGS